MSLPDETSSLPPMEVGARVARLRDRLAEVDCEALLVTSLVNIRYLTGFTGSSALLLVVPDELVFITDGRYADQSAEQLAETGVEARIEARLTEADQREVLTRASRGVARVGLEAAWVTWDQQLTLASEVFPEAELVPTKGLVESLRRAKDEGELARIHAAARAADRALAAVAPMLADGLAEREVALALEVEMRHRGATGPSFETIVASGPNGAKPHARPSSRRVRPGEPVIIDFGAMVDGYCSDMTRTLCVGEPSKLVAAMWEVVAEAQQAGLAAVGPDVKAVDVDSASRAVIAAAGWGEAFVHNTGHGLGLQVHEEPRVTRTSDATLAVGDVVTVEPGVYLREHGGVRIEDAVVVTPEGCRPLTNAPKDFVL